MKAKTIIPRRRANRDVDDAIKYYLSERADEAAVGFVDALERAYERIGRQPGSGSPRYGHESSIAGLRSWPLRGYPYYVFYVERPDHIDVWRVLHAQRDIAGWLREDEDA
jgi:toxin ParE1/3/4